MVLPIHKAIRLFCIDCSGDIRAEVRRCDSKDCQFYAFRMGPTIKELKRTSRLRAIRSYCRECIGGSGFKEIRQCSGKDTCCIWPYRLGHRPGYKNPQGSSKDQP